MAILQPLIDMAEICYRQGVWHVVVSPGSRSAALTLAFARHGGFRMHVCMDERPAGFIALGMAQQIDSPVVLICTSGSAAYNFAPAVSEAFFQQIPLIILTADRPREWQHQYDGQTIYQAGIFSQHVKRSFEISPDYSHRDVQWAINRITNEAILLASGVPAGPVHINVPIREPFYPASEEQFVASEHVRVIKKADSATVWPSVVWEDLLDEWESASKILIAGGQGKPDPQLSTMLARISEEWHIPVLGDLISNLTGSETFIRHQDMFLASNDTQKYRPELLITFGMSFLSKEFKLFIRQNPPKWHWHISEDTFLADPFQSITREIPGKPAPFFESLFEKLDYQSFVENSDLRHDTAFQENWLQHERLARRVKVDIVGNLPVFNDLALLDIVFKSVESKYQLHVANSMSVRYANLLGTDTNWAGVFANRGTSGIDGCVSTAIGAAKVNGQPTLLLVGDVAFLYDRNGLLIDNLPQNLKIVVLNNAGGNIFRMIDGPGNLPELETYFETHHRFSARRTCEDSGIAYFQVSELESLEETVHRFLNFNGLALLEGFTDPAENTRAWKSLKRSLHR